MNVMAIKNTKTLNVETRLLFSLYLCADARGRIELSKDSLARCLEVSRQTIGKYLGVFCNAEILKYKYSGKGMFNPKFYLNVVPEDVSIEYDKFKSDL